VEIQGKVEIFYIVGGTHRIMTRETTMTIFWVINMESTGFMRVLREQEI
jgi:hypothetical protein